MDTPTKPVANRVDADLQMWEKLEKYFTKRYGANVWNDRETQKVRADIYKHIINKYAGKKKNEQEKMELKMLRAQRRAMIKKLYPNPWVRLGRAVGLFALNVVVLAAKLLFRLLKFIIDPTAAARRRQQAQASQSPSQQQNEPSQQQSKSQQQSRQQSQGRGPSKGQGTKQQPPAKTKGAGQSQPAKQPAATKKQAPTQAPSQGQRSTAKVRKLNPRQMAPQTQGKGMRR